MSIERWSFAHISPGKFMMGSPENEDYRYSDESQHEVVISKPFEIGKGLVTQEFWEEFMDHNPSRFKGLRRPVERVSWNDTQNLIAKLNDRQKKYLYRLPTEAEWEYACRAGTLGPYAGDLNKMAWYSKNSQEETHDVGMKTPNAWDIYDMHGNVWEWCQDWYGEYSKDSVTDPIGPSSGSDRVVRGGGWNYYAESLRSARRDYGGPAYSNNGLGFRLARTLRSELLPSNPLPACGSRREAQRLVKQIRAKLSKLEGLCIKKVVK